MRHQGEALAPRLSHEHPVEGIVMVGRQDDGFPRVAKVDSGSRSFPRLTLRPNSHAVAALT